MCFLSSDEYTDLTVVSPLYEMAMSYLQRRELGLAGDPESLSIKEQEAILFVNGLIKQWESDRIKESREEHGKNSRSCDHGQVEGPGQ